MCSFYGVIRKKNKKEKRKRAGLISGQNHKEEKWIKEMRMIG